MKTIFYLIIQTGIFLSFTLLKISAQSVIPCSAFCVTNIQLDSIGQMNVDIHFTGTVNDFIGYPFVSSVIDINGDTVGNGGSFFYFGQIGGTTQTYSLPSLVTDIPFNFQGTIIFSNIDTICTLSYPCTTTGVENEVKRELDIFPNPTNGNININLQPNVYPIDCNVMSFDGKILFQQKLFSSQQLTNLSFLPDGIYILQVFTAKEERIEKKLIIQK